MPLDSGHCDTVRNGKDALYLHPTVFSGVMQEDHIPALQQLLDGANTFRTLETRLYRECFDLTDEEYRQRLEVQTEQIDNAILEAERIGQLIADGRLITAQTRYGQGLRTATEAELKMAENADPMQMHF